MDQSLMKAFVRRIRRTDDHPNKAAAFRNVKKDSIAAGCGFRQDQKKCQVMMEVKYTFLKRVLTHLRVGTSLFT
jgi:hypothetical protein